MPKNVGRFGVEQPGELKGEAFLPSEGRPSTRFVSVSVGGKA